MTAPVTYLLLPDLHIGNPRIDPQLLHLKLEKYVYPQFDQIDVLMIAGDFWDTLLHMSAPSSLVAVVIIRELINLAYEKDFLIRVLRGTITHDRNQNQFFQDTEDGRVRVFDNIAIEYLERYDQRVLYMPDDLPGDNVAEAKLLMESMQLDRVDVVVHHGYFEHLLNHGKFKIPPNTLEVNKFNSIFHPKAILNGHVHRPGVYKNVVSGGSFERFAHGEEEPKGFYLITVDDQKAPATFTFIEDKEAMLFKTIDLTKYESVEEALPVYETWFHKLLEQRTELTGVLHIRILAFTPLIGEVLSDWSHKQAKQLVITKPSLVKEEQVIQNNATELEELPQINRGNLGLMLFDFIKVKHPQITATRVTEILNLVGNNQE